MNIKPKILLVEHNFFVRNNLKSLLEKQGFYVVAVSNTNEAITKIESENPLIIILTSDGVQLKYFFASLEKLQQKIATLQPQIIIFAQRDKSDVPNNPFLQSISALPGVIGVTTDFQDVMSKIWAYLRQPGILENFPEIQNAAETSSQPDDLSPAIGADSQKLKEQIETTVIDPDSESGIVGLVDNLIEYAYSVGASDIHIHNEEDLVNVRLRINGILHKSFSFKKSDSNAIISRIKIMSGMRTDEHRRPQDGRFQTDVKYVHEKFDIRVSVLPTYFGEDVVMRLLVDQINVKAVQDLPLTDRDKAILQQNISKPHGMILVTGPTGSGKSTTLYTILKELNKPEVSIITIEDPVEYSLPGIKQVQVDTETGVTFATGLRSILRQDPNIVMVGEIRDGETAGIAINAALTGHLLLSTLHTRDASSMLPRLIDMGIEPFLIASTVRIAMSQRLVRTICEFCRTEKKLSKSEQTSLASIIPPEFLKDGQIFYSGVGCKKCEFSGYAGRTGVYELIEVNDEIKEAISKHADADAIEKIAIKNGTTTLFQNGFQKIIDGVTTIEEFVRVLIE